MRPMTVIKAVGGLLIALVLAAVAILLTLDVNRYKGTIQDEVQRLTGRKLVLEGDLSLSVGLTPKLIINKARFANAAWGSRPDMVTVERVEAAIELMPALHGEIRLTRVVLIKPDILLETDRKGTANWDLGGEAVAAAAPAATPAGGTAPAPAAAVVPAPGKTTVPFVGALDIEKAHITLKDAAKGTTTTFDFDVLTLSAASPAAPLALTVKGAYNAIPYQVAGTLGPLQSLLGAASAPFPVSLKGDFGGVALSADGAIKDPKAVQGVELKVSIKADSYAGLKGLVPSDGVPPVTLTGDLSGGGSAWKIAGLNATVAKTALTGAVAVNTAGARPKIEATLKSPSVDLREWLGATETVPPAPSKGGKPSQPSTPPGGQAKKVFPSDPLHLDALRAVDARADLQVARLTLPNSMVLEAVAVQGVLDNGRLKLTPAQAKVGDGIVAVALDLTAAPAGSAGISALTAEVKLDKVSLGRLFEQAGKGDLLSAVPTNGTITAKGQGASVAAVLASLDGAVNLSMGQGRIHNSVIDWIGGDIFAQLGEALDPSSQRPPYTELSCGEIHMKSAKGLMDWNKQIAFETTRMNVVSSGSLNLGTEGLDVGVQPYTKNGVGLSAGKLAELLRLQGTLGQPRVGIDAAAAIGAVASVGAAAATGGLSTVVGALIGGATADTAPCATARGEKSKGGASQNSSSQSGTQPAKQAPSGPAGVLNGIGGLFKSN